MQASSPFPASQARPFPAGEALPLLTPDEPVNPQQFLLDQLPLGVLVIESTQARVLSVNAQACRLLGLRAELLLGEAAGAQLQPALAALCQPSRWRTLTPGTRPIRELLSIDSPQGARCLQVQRNVLSWPGQRRPVAMLTLQDGGAQQQLERALRESDARFRELTEAASECLFVTTADGQRLHFSSPLLMDLLGLSSGDLRAGAALLPQRLHPDDLPQYARCQQALAAGESCDSVLRFRHPHRGWRWMRLRSRPQAHAGGQPLIYNVLNDVSEEQQRHRELAEARDQAEAASRAKSEFMATISHELRTPLNGMLGMTELMLEGTLDPAQRRHAEAALHSAQQLRRLVDDLLDFASTRNGECRNEPRAYDPHALAHSCLGALAPLAEAKGLWLRLAAPLPPEPLQAHGDVDKIRKVLDELLANALKFTPSGGIELRLGLETGAAAGRRWLRFSVIDSGIGLTGADLAQLFTPFVQGEAGLARRFGGAGLGLARAQALAAVMGGTISADTDLAHGACFVLRLPLGAPPACANLPAPPPVRAAATILVVDDNPVNQQICAEMLDRLGYRSQVCSDALSALQALSEQHFDLVMMDIQMPGMDGVQALKAFRAGSRSGRRFVTPASTPVLAVTANVLHDDRLQLSEQGFNGYLPKPFLMADLAHMLEDSLGPGNNQALDVQPPQRNQAPRDALNMSTQPEIPTQPKAGAVLDAQALQHLRDLDPNGSNKLLERVVQAFTKSLDRLLPELAQARMAGLDLGVVRHVSHTLKSSSASLGALELSQRCAEIEAMARNGQAEGLDKLLDAMHDELARVRLALAELLIPSS